jgi:hypothetical protein
MTVHGSAESYLDPRDLEYAETLEGDERKMVVATVSRFRRQDCIEVGDALPQLELLELTDGARVSLPSLLRAQPLVLVFGSFT